MASRADRVFVNVFVHIQFSKLFKTPGMRRAVYGNVRKKNLGVIR